MSQFLTVNLRPLGGESALGSSPLAGWNGARIRAQRSLAA